MKIVIDIPEELYKRVKTKYIPLPHDFADVMDNAINNSTPFEQECYITGEQWNEFMKEHRRPQGEWVADDYAGIHCNKCDYIPLKDVVETIYPDGTKKRSGNFNLTPYCPNCGAKMKKEK